MRNLLYKNLTSEDRKRRVISSSEVADKEGVRTIIHRHLIYIIKEVSVNNVNTDSHSPYLYVLKERNHLQQREKFFCRIKGRAYVISRGKLYLVIFMHSLKIILKAVPDAAAH